MKGRSILGAIVAALLAGTVAGGASAQQKSLKDQIVGTWTLASWEQTLANGGKNERFGASPKGVNMYDSNGHFSLIIMRPQLPKISSGDPEKPSPQEAEAITVGSIAYYGTYTVDEASKTITLTLDASTLTNQLGIPQKRTITSISATEMKYSNPTSVRGGKIELVWKRAQ
jgi:hypothetical protein